MKKEYDFSKGERGKFYRSSAKVNLPIYLEADNVTFLETIARKNHKNLTTIVNELIKSDKAILKIAG
jgi:hypothetical protein